MLAVALLVLTLLAMVSLLNSGVPAIAAWPAAAASTWFGIRRMRSEWNRPPMQLVFPGNEAAAHVDGVTATDMEVTWRGPLAFARWSARDGQVRRLAWWPDTLPPAMRRELRLAAPGRKAARRRL